METETTSRLNIKGSISLKDGKWVFKGTLELKFPEIKAD